MFAIDFKQLTEKENSIRKITTMDYRKFGNTELNVSVIGFGSWGIGGPAMAKDLPIGWGNVDDRTSVQALKKAFDQGINFYDTADIYGVGHSEELIGKTFGNRQDVIIASKAGHLINAEGDLSVNYSKSYIIQACEKSLKRLRRETIDYYQLHSAQVKHLQQGECIEAMETLQKAGKIRYWGVSLNTFQPQPEADFLMQHQLGNGFQIVFNLLNQRALPLIRKATAAGYGIIARMPLQFGLLTGKFNKNSRFAKNDHRVFRLTPELLEKADHLLQEVWLKAKEKGISKTAYSLSFCYSFPEISTVIPGIKTPEQVLSNTTGIVKLSDEEIAFIQRLYQEKFTELIQLIEKNG